MKSDSLAAVSQPAGALPRSICSPLPWIALSLLGILVFFREGFVSLLEAWERPEYSHGYLIPLVAVYLFLSQMRNIPSHAEPRSSGIGLAVVVVGLFVGLMGNLVRIPDIVTYGFLVCLAGFILIIAGSRRGLIFWAPWLYLAFMLPLPNFLYWPLSIKLQAVSSQIGVALISLMGVPVFLDGNIIDLGTYKLQVAEACSGLRYLFPLMSFGFLFAVLYRGPAWHKIVLFLSSMPLTILMNSIRIGIIGLLVDRYGIEQAEGFLHAFEGWVIFMACIVLLFVEALALRRLTSNSKSASAILDLDTSFIPAQLARAKNIVLSRELVIAASLAFLAGILWHFAPARAVVTPERQQLAVFPMTMGQWKGTSGTIDANIEAVLAADDYLLAGYESQADHSYVNLFIAYYKSQTEGSGIHSPEVCIPAGGWEVSRWQQVEVTFASPSRAPLRVNRAVIQKGVNRQLVYYWFEQRGRRMTNDFVAKGYTVWDSLRRGRTDGALVRVVTPVRGKEGQDAAEDRLRQFLEITLKELHRYVPE